MARTPDVLRTKWNFKIAPDPGSRAVPRALHAFKGEARTDKRNFLGTYYPALMSGALLAEGQERKHRRLVTQQEMANRGGLKQRPSYTRRLSRVANRAEGWDTVEARREHADRLHRAAITKIEKHCTTCAVCVAGEICADADRLRRLARAPRLEHRVPADMPVIRRNRNFGRPNSMAFNDLPERKESWAVVETATGKIVKKSFSQRRAVQELETLARYNPHTAYQVEAVALDPKQYHSPAVEQLAAMESGSTWWDAGAGVDGFKSTSRYIWDPNLMDPDDTSKPLGLTARLVMSAYEHFGLQDEFRDPRSQRVTKARGFLEIHQQKIADYCGIDRKSVYNANKKWERLGVLRIAAPHRKEDSDGWKSEGPQRVLFLPMMTLTPEEAEFERQQFAAKLQEVIAKEGAIRQAMLDRAAQIHQELLTAWTGDGQPHRMQEFWRECAKRMTASEISFDVIARLVPAARPPE